MIYITGDIHGDPSRFNSHSFPEQKEMTKDDYVIILGDFGLVWDYEGENKTEKWWLDWLNDKPFTTLFICGNHENFDRLYKCPVKEWNGGKVHEIRPSVLHLMRGEVFNLNGKKFFAFGGASSHDVWDGILDPIEDAELINKWRYDYTKVFRIKGMSWWKEELPTKEEMNWGEENLKKHGNSVDFILSHTPSASIIALLGHGHYEQDVLTNYLEDVKCNIEYTRMFSGHMHMDKQINDKDILLYKQIVRIA